MLVYAVWVVQFSIHNGLLGQWDKSENKFFLCPNGYDYLRSRFMIFCYDS